MSSKRSICSMYSEVEDLAKELLTLDFSRSVRSEIKRIAKRLEKVATEAAFAGTAMEDRLSDYRTTIESLGFKRIK